MKLPDNIFWIMPLHTAIYRIKRSYHLLNTILNQNNNKKKTLSKEFRNKKLFKLNSRTIQYVDAHLKIKYLMAKYLNTYRFHT